MVGIFNYAYIEISIPTYIQIENFAYLTFMYPLWLLTQTAT